MNEVLRVECKQSLVDAALLVLGADLFVAMTSSLAALSFSQRWHAIEGTTHTHHIAGDVPS